MKREDRKMGHGIFMAKGRAAARTLAALLLLSAASSVAGQATPANDKEKRKLLRSMEMPATGWDFSPDFYFWLMHKKYSGAKLRLTWTGIKVDFKEGRSDIRKVGPRRAVETGLHEARKEEATRERKAIDTLYKEAALRYADRAVDLTYMSYRGDFDRMKSHVEDGLRYCMERSGGGLESQADAIRRRYAAVCDDIRYLHQTGPFKKLIENAKRREGYEAARKELQDLERATMRLCMAAASCWPDPGR